MSFPIVVTLMALATLIFGGFIYCRNFELFLCLLITLAFECFYVPPGIQGPEGYKYVLLPIIIALFAVSVVSGKASRGRYGGWVISFLAISILGLIVAYFSGQELALGIKA